MYSVRSGGVSCSGFWVGAWAGSWVGSTAGVSVGSLLVPGFGSEGVGAEGFSSGGAGASPSASEGWVPVLPTDLLVSPSTCVVASHFGLSMSSHIWLSWLSSPPAASSNCSSSVPVNLAVAMPLGW